MVTDDHSVTMVINDFSCNQQNYDEGIDGYYLNMDYDFSFKPPHHSHMSVTTVTSHMLLW